MTQPTLFNPHDRSTWPPLRTPVLFFYERESDRKAIVATMWHVIHFDESEDINFEPCGIDGYEYECDLSTIMPFAWQEINWPENL